MRKQVREERKHAEIRVSRLIVSSLELFTIPKLNLKIKGTLVEDQFSRLVTKSQLTLLDLAS